MKKIIWENLYNDLPVHVAKALREARLQPEQVTAKTDGELMAIEGIKQEDIEAIRNLYNADTIDDIKQVVEEEATVEKKEVKAQPKKAIQPKKRSARYRSLAKGLSRDTVYSVKDAVEKLGQMAKSGKLKTVELTVNTRETGVRGEIKLPHSTGKVVRIAVFSPEVEKTITAGKIDFDILLATPADMPKLAKHAKVLGPKGVMPNPRSGTITEDPAKRAKELSSGATLPYKTESKFPIIHLSLGPVNQKEQDLLDNITESIKTIGTGKIKSAFLSCTHTPSVRLNVSSI